MKQEVLNMLTNLVGSDVKDPAQTLVSDLSFDSLRMVTLLIMIEDTFDIELDQADMNPFLLITIQDVIDLVERYVQKEV